MKILQISSARSIGGGERHVANLSNELTKRGHDIFAAVVRDSPMPGAMFEVPAVNIAEFPLRNALDISSAVKIGKFATENEIELINAHFAKDYPVAAAAARISGIPLVVTRHVLFPMNRMHRIFLRDVKYVIAPSNAVAESLRSQGIFSNEKIVTIHYGLDVDSFPKRNPLGRNVLCVGSIGNLGPVKGFDTLIRAAKIVVKEIPDVSFKIVGEDRSRDGRNEKELREMVAELDLKSTVELTGWSDNVAEALGGFDVFVSGSRSESFGFVIAEAMLAGVPVIATATEGAKEIISNPSLGKLVSVESAEDLSHAIVDLLSDLQKRELYAKSGRDHIRQNFSLKRMADDTEALYRRTIASR